MNDETYLPVEDVAARLGLPLGVLLRRVEAGDVPARRVEGPGGTRYELSLRDLGIELPVEEGSVATAIAPPPAFYTVPDDAPDEPVVELTGNAQSDAVTEAVPPPSRPDRPTLTLVESSRGGPLADIANMTIDPRELVAGLLDRWERTLEQRIHAEQRQRFEAELTTRQNLVKQLQLELRTARAEHAAAQADKERVLADRTRQVVDRDRELAELRRLAAAAQAQVQQAQRKRGWFFRR